ncbi:PIN domain-containing protein [Sphingomonas sp. ID0503]|uniref:PIN domain-containing protein n=1 Tax=Sphingomonas sp. ID0503 TaxID=3399691 RepID=UPI003AFB67AF
MDANILIDALLGYPLAHDELRYLAGCGAELWISRMVWMEVLSKGEEDLIGETMRFLEPFGIDEIDGDTAERAAQLRRERPRLKSSDAIILSSAQLNGRTLVTRNTRDFPTDMPGVRVPYTL